MKQSGAACCARSGDWGKNKQTETSAGRSFQQQDAVKFQLSHFADFGQRFLPFSVWMCLTGQVFVCV